MDDPWGSPWAEESSEPLPKITIATSKKPIAPKNEPQLSEDPRSPWDNDDAEFGEWAAFPAAEKPAAIDGLGAGTVHKHKWDLQESPAIHSQEHTDLPTVTTFPALEGDPEAPGIDEVIEKSRPILENTRLEDPWAVVADADLQQHDTLVEAPKKTNDTPEIVSGGTELRDDSAAAKSIDTSEPTPSKQEALPESNDNTSVADAGVDIPSDNSDQIRIKVDEQESLSSRLSSSRSERSHDNLPDSTRTSFEEERPPLKRNESSKVKQLVDHFDGLAAEKTTTDNLDVERVSSTGTPRLTLSRVISREPSQYGESDFGDFEEGKISARISRNPSMDHLDAAPKEKEQLPEKNLLPQNDGPVSDAGHSSEIAIPRPEAHGPITFDTDLALVNKLFSSKVEEATDSTSNLLEIEENIQDTFSSVEQRKTWYRISRYGPMRKHNSGDDENYVRINWANSTVREETLKIISRWMQEDRLNGGVLFGSSSKAGGIFGWGQPEQQSGLSHFSQGHDPKRRDTKGSISLESPVQPHGTAGRHDRRRSTVEGKFGSRKSIDGTPVTAPHFSWSTTQPEPQTNGTDIHTGGPPSSNSINGAFSLPASSQKASTSLQSAILPHVAGAEVPSLPSTSKIVEVAPLTQPIQTDRQVPNTDQDEGDEWGEMVSSPITMAAPTLNDSSHSHRSTQSLVGLLTPQLSGGEFPLRPTHKSALSESSQTRNPLTPDSPSSAFKTIPLATSNSDPWATADFSFFDSPSTSTHVPSASLAQPKSQFQNHSHRTSKDEMEEQRLVNEIIRNLPDLSYMLRR